MSRCRPQYLDSLEAPRNQSLDRDLTHTSHLILLFRSISQSHSQLRKEQELQKQKLWHAFQEKNKELELQHRQQLEHKFQVVSVSLPPSRSLLF